MPTLSFDPETITNRVIDRMKIKLQEKFGDVQMLFFGTNRRQVEAFAEEIAELARYDEVLTQESKWKLARNITSIMAQADFFNYRPHRLVGARGATRVSASKTFDGSYPNPIYIRRWDTFSSQAKTYTAESEGILLNSKTFVDVPCCEGVPQTLTFEITEAAYPEGTAYLKLLVEDPAMENAFFDVTVNGTLWSEILDIRMSESSSDTVFVQKTALDFSNVEFSFGNGIFGKKISYGDVIVIKYIRTTGTAGNLVQAGLVTTVDGSYVDSLNNSVILYCTNVASITGGDKSEDIESIRANAPLSYQTTDRAITKDDYITLIKKKGFVDRAIVWGEEEVNEDLGNPPGTYIPTEENLVYISGFNVDPDTLRGTTISTSLQSDIRNYLNTLKGPTDILKFVDTDFIYVVFTVSAAVNDRRYTLDDVRSRIFTGLKTRYSLLKTTHKESLFFSQYYQFLNAIEGVFFHTTTISFVRLAEFANAWTFFMSLGVNNIKPGSLKIYISDDSITWNLMAIDDGSTNLIGQPIDPLNLPLGNYALPSGRISYSDGVLSGGPDGSVIVTSGISGSSYWLKHLKFEFKIDDSEGGNVKLTKRNQIYSFYDATISAFIYDPSAAN